MADYYTQEQLSRYLDYIGFDAAAVGSPPGSQEFLAALLLRHLAAVPFESLAFHYSRDHLVRLDPQLLFDKMVGTGRGGYCMEVATLFGGMLRALGYQTFYAAARVSYTVAGRHEGGYMGLNHLINLVTIDGQRYLADVGFGSEGACRPLALRKDGTEAAGIGAQRLRLELQTLPEHRDRSQQVWVYSTRADETSEWRDGFCFNEAEMFDEDVRVLNLATMTLRQSFFLQHVICLSVELDPSGREPVGLLVLMDGAISRKRGTHQSETIELFASEQARIDALQKWFGIRLLDEERRGIRDLPTEIRG